MTTHRVIVTTAPTAAQVETVHQMLAFAAVARAGHDAAARGTYDAAQVSTTARRIADRLVAAIVDETPVDAATARMLVSALTIVGCRAQAVAD